MMNLQSLLKSSLGKSTFWNLAGAGIPLVLGLFTIPTLVSGMGKESFGLLTLIWTAIGYFSLFDFGLGRALTHSIAAVRAEKGMPGRSMLFTGSLSSLAPGLLGALLFYLMAEPLAAHWLKISPDLVPQAVAAFRLAAISIPLVSLSSGLRGMLEGYEDFRAAAILRMSLGALNFLLPYLLVSKGYPGLELIVISLIAARVLNILHNLLLLRKHPVYAEDHWFSPAALRQLLGYGSWLSLSNLIGPIMVNFDRYLLAAMLSAELVAYYTVPQDMVLRLLFVPIALSAALFPRMTLLFSSGNNVQSAQLYRKALGVVGLSMGAITLLLSLLAKAGLTLWLGAEFADISWQLTVVLLLGVFFNSMAIVPFTAIQARGGVKTTSLLLVVQLVVYLPLLYLAIQAWGLMGAALVWSTRTTLDFFILLAINSRKSAVLR
ncbi:MAG: oligosaccharide flippase family protein [Bacteroidia bacterium]